MKGKGLISYEQFPVDPSITQGPYLSSEGPAFDAVSIFSFESQKDCEECWAIPEVVEDTAKCMDVETMIVLATER